MFSVQISESVFDFPPLDLNFLPGLCHKERLSVILLAFIVKTWKEYLIACMVCGSFDMTQ